MSFGISTCFDGFEVWGCQNLLVF